MHFGTINIVIYFLGLAVTLALIDVSPECRQTIKCLKSNIARQLLWGIVLALIPIAVLGIINVVFFRSFAVFQFLKLGPIDALLFCGFQLLVAITEELFFRGYLMYLFTRITKSSVLAIFITAALFAAVHILFNGSLVSFAIAFVIGILFAFALVKYKHCSLGSLILAHLLYDLAIINI